MERVGENKNIFIYPSIFSEEQSGVSKKGIKDAKILLHVETCCDRCVTYVVIPKWLRQPYVETETILHIRELQ